MLADDFGVGQIFWSLIWFFLFIIWIMLLFRVFGDIFTDHKLSGWGKAGWSILVVLLPFLGVFIYLIVRGPSMAERDAQAMKAQEAATRQYIQDAAGTSTSPAEELTKLMTLRDSGAIDDAEFQKLKAKVVGS
jgi:Phospholipase_D-nuclease N-terminal